VPNTAARRRRRGSSASDGPSFFDLARPGRGLPGAPNMPAPELPNPFGRYRIVKPLGRGGMGSVYLAHDTQLDRPVALKVPHFARPWALKGPHLEGKRGAVVVERFSREARAAATLHHPTLCPVYDVGEVDGTPYLTMAFVEGRPLADYLQPGRPLPQRQAAAL